MTKTRLSILLLILAVCLPVLSGNITKKYKTHLTETGTVYFIMPQKMAKAKGSAARKDLLFDVTTLDSSDSLTVAATVLTQRPVTDSLATITSGGQSLSLPMTFLYRDLDKKGYVNRIKIGMTRSQFLQLFSADTPFLIDYGQGNQFAFPTGKWADERQMILSILELIELNR